MRSNARSTHASRESAIDKDDAISLDPTDWTAFRAEAHRALDLAIDGMESIRERYVWQPIPAHVKAAIAGPMPQDGLALDDVVQRFAREIAPYPIGNTHPRFFGWVHGSGNAAGVVAEILAAAMNTNVGGREQAAVYVERAVLGWFRDLFGLPSDASGLLVTGTSLANLIAIVVARTASDERGIDRLRLRGYVSRAAHVSMRKAFATAGLAEAVLRVIPTDDRHRMLAAELDAAIAQDVAAGYFPFVVCATAGTVDIGATDDLTALADIAAARGAWYHVDGAFGAMAMLAPSLRDRLRGLERADSIAFDAHKWLHVPYDAGALLVRDPALHRRAFAREAPYLRVATEGIASGMPWFTDFGPDLSRGFRALKIWFTFQHYGARRLGAAIERNVAQAAQLGRMVDNADDLELMAPIESNIVCFRYCTKENASGEYLDRFNGRLALDLATSGRAVVSTTTLSGRLSLRANFTNHRTQNSDLAILLDAVREVAAKVQIDEV